MLLSNKQTNKTITNSKINVTKKKRTEEYIYIQTNWKYSMTCLSAKVGTKFK